VNVAIRDAAVSSRLREDHARDVAASRELTLDVWRRRPWWEKALTPFIWILERQQ
jgi:phosphatidylserine/phosphatidylglycerophosphate/cardiolipin synthase-like enzyme